MYAIQIRAVRSVRLSWRRWEARYLPRPFGRFKRTSVRKARSHVACAISRVSYQLANRFRSFTLLIHDTSLIFAREIENSWDVSIIAKAVAVMRLFYPSMHALKLAWTEKSVPFYSRLKQLSILLDGVDNRAGVYHDCTVYLAARYKTFDDFRGHPSFLDRIVYRGDWEKLGGVKEIPKQSRQREVTLRSNFRQKEREGGKREGEKYEIHEDFEAL